ncbi:hypothetical protein [Rhodonellum psychrophilum]|nr:hypothetical protein [Rhodonellum psychrophilum]
MRVSVLTYMLLVSVFGFMSSFKSYAQADLISLEEQLSKNGFEQVVLTLISTDQDFILYFEHRAYRNPLDAMKLARRLAEEFGVIVKVYVPLHMGVPLGSYEFDGNGFVGKTLSENRKREFSYAYKSDKYRFNFYMLPEVQSRFGYHERPLQTKINWITATTVNLGRGFGLHTGILVPIVNELDSQEKNIRLAPTYLSTFSNFLPNHYLLSHTGLFYNDRFGVNLQYRFFDADKRWSFGWELAVSGFYILPSSGLYMEGLNDEMVLFDFEYYFPKEMLTLKLQGGQFMYFDRGARVDLIRQYGSVDVGLYGLSTTNGFNAGFMLHFPLVPRKILRSKKAELRMTESFKWSYFFNNEGNIGTRVRSGPMLSDITRQHRYLFIKNQR